MGCRDLINARLYLQSRGASKAMDYIEIQVWRILTRTRLLRSFIPWALIQGSMLNGSQLVQRWSLTDLQNKIICNNDEMVWEMADPKRISKETQALNQSISSRWLAECKTNRGLIPNLKYSYLPPIYPQFRVKDKRGSTQLSTKKTKL